MNWRGEEWDGRKGVELREGEVRKREGIGS